MRRVFILFWFVVILASGCVSVAVFTPGKPKYVLNCTVWKSLLMDEKPKWDTDRQGWWIDGGFLPLNDNTCEVEKIYE